MQATRLSTLAVLFFIVACSDKPSTLAPPTPNDALRLSSDLPFIFTVQAHTSRDGQIWSTGSQQCGVITHNHTVLTPQGQPAQGVTKEWKYCATNPNSPFNGGWINIYAVTPDNPDYYVGQAYADLSHEEIEYIYPSLQFRLVAFASGLQMMSNGDQYDCIFENFEGYPPGVNDITVGPAPAAPLAHFACFKRNPPNP